MRHTLPTLTLTVLALMGSLWAGPSTLAAEDVSAGFTHFESHNPSSTLTLDHSPWNAILQKYVSTDSTGLNRFAYGAVDDGDYDRLDEYLDTLQEVPIARYARDEQMAFWINLYNALTLQVILDHMPVETITAIQIDGTNPWDAAIAEVDGVELTLNDIEHRILRPIWQDPRIHYGVNCASIGCPNLARDAFTAENLDLLLDTNAHGFVNHPRGVRFEGGPEDGERLIVSSIYIWFGEDFGDGTEGLIEHLCQYAEKDLAERLAAYGGDVDHDYDWRLNR